MPPGETKIALIDYRLFLRRGFPWEIAFLCGTALHRTSAKPIPTTRYDLALWLYAPVAQVTHLFYIFCKPNSSL